MRHLLITCAALSGAMMLAAPALADVIDGTWCHSDGRSLSIDGPTIITPGGNKITGDYERHSFFYTVPANEKGAGGLVRMILVNEATVNLWLDTAAPEPGTVEVWLRCQPVA